MIRKVSNLYRQAYSGLPRKSWVLFVALLVNASGMMVIFFLTLYMTRKLGFTVTRVGSMIVGPIIGTLVYWQLGPKTLWFGCGILGCLLCDALSLLNRKLKYDYFQT